MSMLPCIMSSLLMTMQTSRLNDHNDIQLKCYWSLGNGLDTVSSMRALWFSTKIIIWGKKKINHILFLFIDVLIYMLADEVVFEKVYDLVKCKVLWRQAAAVTKNLHWLLVLPTRLLKCIHFRVHSFRLSRNLYFVFGVGVCGSLRVW